MCDKINDFMYLYMYHLENFLFSRRKELAKISFQSDEANTDRPLKEYLKNLIENEFNCIPSNSEIANVNIEEKKYSSLEALGDMYISKVLLPEEITPEIKASIKETKSSTYTNPDICFVIRDNLSSFYEAIELKSTKRDSIPGSSIQQILPDQWVIFIKHTKTDTDIATGKYINTINSKMQFPDRSPRPQVSFIELKNWNKKYRSIKNNSLIYTKDENASEKFQLISDWQNVLSNRWIEMLFESNTSGKNEPWYNNNMRKFILSFLNKYESLTTEEQLDFKLKVKNSIIE